MNVPLGLVVGPVVHGGRTAGADGARAAHSTGWGALLNAAAFGLLVTGVDGLGGDCAVGLAGTELAAGLVFGALLVWQQSRRQIGPDAAA